MNLVELSTNTINIIGLTPISDVGENNTAFDYELVFIRNWNPMGVLIGCILWTSFRKLLPVNTAGKILALLHAIVMLFMGVQVILKIGHNSFTFPNMLATLRANFVPLSSICNVASYISISFFIVDSFGVQRQYLKHHISAVCTWMLAALSGLVNALVHGVVCIFLFEIGAFLVQLSRFSPNNCFFRSAICIGYTMSRVLLCWYVSFIMYHSYYDIASEPPLIKIIAIIGIDIMLLILMAMNIKWTIMQWRILITLFIKKDTSAPDFFTSHQIIIGNSAPNLTVGINANQKISPPESVRCRSVLSTPNLL